MGSKILKILVGIIFILGVAGFVMVAGSEKDTPEMASAVSFMVNLAVVLLIAAVVIAVLLSLVSLVKKPAALKKTLVSLGILAVVLAVSYFMASDAAVLDTQGVVLKDGQAGSVSKWSGTGLNISLFLLLVGGVFFVIDLLRGLIKS